MYTYCEGSVEIVHTYFTQSDPAPTLAKGRFPKGAKLGPSYAPPSAGSRVSVSAYSLMETLFLPG